MTPLPRRLYAIAAIILAGVIFVALNIAADLGTNTAYVGFTAGTGAGYENQDILNWSFANDTSLGTPEPSTLLMLGSGALALVGVARRKLSL